MKKLIKYLAFGLIAIAIIAVVGFKGKHFLGKTKAQETSILVEANNDTTAPLKLQEPAASHTVTLSEPEDDCIFDQKTQNDDFIKNIPELKGYHWDQNSKTATISLEGGDTLLITRGGCASFGVSAEFRIKNKTELYTDWAQVSTKVLWVANILKSEFAYQPIKADLDSKLYTLNDIPEGTTLSFSAEELQDNNYSIDRIFQDKLTIIRLKYYIN